ncbi:MAG: DUF5615 family PIN-like protein [Chitinophagales bacterium]|nr:DUF5615 family PIN-like protein [Chitinophagales bacterium]
MNFFADEGLDYPLVNLLRQRNHKVFYAAEEMKSADDNEILKKANELNCILITKDKDFGEMIIRNKKNSSGVLLIRIDALNLEKNCVLIADLIDKYASELRNCFTVVQEDKIRIRQMEEK